MILQTIIYIVAIVSYVAFFGFVIFGLIKVYKNTKKENEVYRNLLLDSIRVTNEKLDAIYYHLENAKKHK